MLVPLVGAVTGCLTEPLPVGTLLGLDEVMPPVPMVEGADVGLVVYLPLPLPGVGLVAVMPPGFLPVVGAGLTVPIPGFEVDVGVIPPAALFGTLVMLPPAFLPP